MSMDRNATRDAPTESTSREEEDLINDVSHQVNQQVRPKAYQCAAPSSSVPGSISTAPTCGDAKRLHSPGLQMATMVGAPRAILGAAAGYQPPSSTTSVLPPSLDDRRIIEHFLGPIDPQREYNHGSVLSLASETTGKYMPTPSGGG